MPVVLIALVVLGLVASPVAAVPAGQPPARGVTVAERLFGAWGGKQPSWPDDARPGSLLVTTEAPVVAARLVVEGHRRSSDRVVSVHVPPGRELAEAARLRSLPGVVAVEPDRLRPGLRAPNDPSYPQQWAHEVGRTSGAWDVTVGDASVKVAIIDSGIDGTHPDLAGNLVEQVEVRGGVARRLGVGFDNDSCGIGHGTFVAGIAGATGDNGLDVAGVAWRVSLVDIAAGDRTSCGLFADSDVLAGLQYAVRRRVDVVNLSLGAPGDACPTAFQSAFDDARRAGVVVVAAAGNEQERFPGITSVPASCNGVIGVGAVGETGSPAPYSNANDWVDLAAPGGDMSGAGRGVLSTARGGRTEESEGTSFAAPFVAGAAALLRAVQPSLTPDEIEAVLEATAQRSSSSRRTASTGWGIVDVGQAVRTVQQGGTLPALRPEPTFPVGLVVRVSAQDRATDAVRQAVAVSKFVFTDSQAAHVVIARRDDFADALAGSSLGFGVGPVLFSGPTGSLPVDTRLELQRVLPDGGRVYLLGGSAALPAGLNAEIEALGYEVVRLAGTTREATAAAVASEIPARLATLGFDSVPAAIVATGRQWPDAVTAGSIGAWFGVPILLTAPDTLSPATRAILEKLGPELLYVVGGTSAVSAAAAAQAGQASGATEVVRLAGADRHGTAVAVAREFRRVFSAYARIDPVLAVGVNLRRDGAFAHVLSASAAVGAFSGVFVPLEGERGEIVPQVAADFACSIDVFKGLVVGEGDVVQEATKERLNELLEHLDC
jgi:putative cell wall-binding protein